MVPLFPELKVKSGTIKSGFKILKIFKSCQKFFLKNPGKRGTTFNGATFYLQFRKKRHHF